MISLTPRQVESHLKQWINNSEKVILKGFKPTAICLEGPAGISKTSVVRQIAESCGYKVHVVNTAMIDDLGHLTGFPQEEFLVRVNGVNRWLPSAIFTKLVAGGTGEYLSQSRMSYAIPDWLQSIGEDDKFLLLFDDYTRGLPHVMQACMTIIEEYRYHSWNLPKNTIIALTSNPEGEGYSVSSLDDAQKTRMRYVNVKFDVLSWVSWAEKNNVDERCINFVLSNIDSFNDGVNARALTKFFVEIGEMDDFQSTEFLGFATIVGQGLVGEYITNLFISFVNNKLDHLPSMEEIVFKSENPVDLIESITKSSKDEGYKVSIASVFAKRLVSYLCNNAEAQKQINRENSKKIIDLIVSHVFTQDHIYYMTQELLQNDKSKIYRLVTTEGRLFNNAIS